MRKTGSDMHEYLAAVATFVQDFARPWLAEHPSARGFIEAGVAALTGDGDGGGLLQAPRDERVRDMLATAALICRSKAALLRDAAGAFADAARASAIERLELAARLIELGAGIQGADRHRQQEQRIASAVEHLVAELRRANHAA